MKLYNLFFIVLITSVSVSQAQSNMPWLHGTITNYPQQVLDIYRIQADTLLLVDSVLTTTTGTFALVTKPYTKGMYKVELSNKQSFLLIYDGKPVQLKTKYSRASHNNVAADSLQILMSDENKLLAKFLKLQLDVNIANYMLLQMMRLYPLTDAFHSIMEHEYTRRFATMDKFIQAKNNAKSLAMQLAKAYYTPIIPSWKEPDYWRDSVLALHYFDYFNPADSLYFYTTVLPEKIEMYLTMCTNKVDAYGQPIKSELMLGEAAKEFLNNAQGNAINFDFCLNYILRKFKKEHKDDAFLYVYDAFAMPEAGNCSQQNGILNRYSASVNVLRNLQLGSLAPNFEIEKNKLTLYGLQGNYTLLLFYATWCPHCVEVMPKIKEQVTNYSKNKPANSLITLAISLDTDNEAWQKFVTANSLFSFLNFSELKGWKSNVVKQYNVYATPTMLLLDTNKKIIAKIENVTQLQRALMELPQQ